MVTPHWPLFDLVVRTPRLACHYLTADLALDVADLAGRGVHPPDQMPFRVPWTDAAPGELERNTLQHLWGLWATHKPDVWTLPFAVVAGGAVVGFTVVRAEHFAVLRQASTGSWLGLAHQGQGLGTEFRHAMLQLIFAGLGAERAMSGAYDDNPASLGVSRKLGYRSDGEQWVPRRGEPAREIRLVLDRDTWASRRRSDITIEGLQPCLGLLGLG
jgi:RimJ/RimL family protein N-acetyltransferase